MRYLVITTVLLLFELGVISALVLPIQTPKQNVTAIEASSNNENLQFNATSDVYGIQESGKAKTPSFINPKPEKPTLREIVYYHMIERPYGSSVDKRADTRDFNDDFRPFTNGHGFPFGYDVDDDGDEDEGNASKNNIDDIEDSTPSKVITPNKISTTTPKLENEEHSIRTTRRQLFDRVRERYSSRKENLSASRPKRNVYYEDSKAESPKQIILYSPDVNHDVIEKLKNNLGNVFVTPRPDDEYGYAKPRNSSTEVLDDSSKKEWTNSDGAVVVKKPVTVYEVQQFHIPSVESQKEYVNSDMNKLPKVQNNQIEYYQPSSKVPPETWQIVTEEEWDPSQDVITISNTPRPTSNNIENIFTHKNNDIRTAQSVNSEKFEAKKRDTYRDILESDAFWMLLRRFASTYANPIISNRVKSMIKKEVAKQLRNTTTYAKSDREITKEKKDLKATTVKPVTTTVKPDDVTIDDREKNKKEILENFFKTMLESFERYLSTLRKNSTSKHKREAFYEYYITSSTAKPDEWQIVEETNWSPLGSTLKPYVTNIGSKSSPTVVNSGKTSKVKNNSADIKKLLDSDEFWLLLRRISTSYMDPIISTRVKDLVKVEVANQIKRMEHRSKNDTDISKRNDDEVTTAKPEVPTTDKPENVTANDQGDKRKKLVESFFKTLLESFEKYLSMLHYNWTTTKQKREVYYDDTTSVPKQYILNSPNTNKDVIDQMKHKFSSLFDALDSEDDVLETKHDTQDIESNEEMIDTDRENSKGDYNLPEYNYVWNEKPVSTVIPEIYYEIPEYEEIYIKTNSEQVEKFWTMLKHFISSYVKPILSNHVKDLIKEEVTNYLKNYDKVSDDKNNKDNKDNTSKVDKDVIENIFKPLLESFERYLNMTRNDKNNQSKPTETSTAKNIEPNKDGQGTNQHATTKKPKHDKNNKTTTTTESPEESLEDDDDLPTTTTKKPKRDKTDKTTTTTKSPEESLEDDDDLPTTTTKKPKRDKTDKTTTTTKSPEESLEDDDDLPTTTTKKPKHDKTDKTTTTTKSPEESLEDDDDLPTTTTKKPKHDKTDKTTTTKSPEESLEDDDDSPISTTKKPKHDKKNKTTTTTESPEESLEDDDDSPATTTKKPKRDKTNKTTTTESPDSLEDDDDLPATTTKKPKRDKTNKTTTTTESPDSLEDDDDLPATTTKKPKHVKINETTANSSETTEEANVLSITTAKTTVSKKDTPVTTTIQSDKEASEIPKNTSKEEGTTEGNVEQPANAELNDDSTTKNEKEE